MNTILFPHISILSLRSFPAKDIPFWSPTLVKHKFDTRLNCIHYLIPHGMQFWLKDVDVSPLQLFTGF